MPAILFIIVSYVIRQLYMPAGRSLKRLEAASKIWQDFVI